MSESSETPATAEVQTAFFVVVGLDGVISVHTTEIPSVSLQREATLFDIETYGSQLVRNVGRVLQGQYTRALTSGPDDLTPGQRVSDALLRRAQED